MSARYNDKQRQQLLSIALQSIRHSLALSEQMSKQYQHVDPILLEHQSCFVTLYAHNTLRGCMGSLQAYEPLIDNVINNAYCAAFKDPRFQPLAADELPGLFIHISILSPSRPLYCSNEQELLKQLKPTIDGLTIRDRNQCATFLPSVWEQLSEPSEFLNQLKKKAGFSPHYWSQTLTVERYTVESFEYKVTE